MVGPGEVVYPEGRRVRTISDGSVRRRTVGSAAIFLVLVGVLAGCASTGWPTSSKSPMAELDHPRVETRVQGLSPPVDHGYRFVVFGDQRALADGEWQQMMRHIGDLSAQHERLLFMIDTGDIVKDGRHTDQFARLAEILSPASDLAYLVSVGNHEVKNNKSRENAAAVLGYLDPEFSTGRMYYRKDIGAVRFLFLDTNDFTYGDQGRGQSFERAEAQMEWLAEELASDDRGPEASTVAVMHHPFVMSSKKHLGQALRLWNRQWGGRYLPELLIEGGVDVVLTGHTHTYERFVLEREGKRMHVVNVSGRPRGFYAGSRRAREMQGREVESLRERGWERLAGWRVRQEDAMTKDTEANQFAAVTVEPDGSLSMELFFLDEGASGGLRRDRPITLD